MSDRLANFPALLAELTPECNALIAQYEQPRSALLPIIHLFQSREGFTSPEAMRAAATMLDLTPAVVESTVSFYTLFFRKPVGKYVLQVCRGLSCSISGANDIMKYFRERLGIGHLQTTSDGMFSYEEVECLAACDKPTCMQVNLEFVYSLTPAIIDQMIAAMRAGTYATAPMAQTDAPGKTWQLDQNDEVSTGGKSKGSQDVSHPNNAGGLGDSAGVIMLDRIVDREFAFRGRTSERVVLEEPAQIKELVSEDAHH
jgi:NADH:ubiquinone oxidoreductase subunit E